MKRFKAAVAGILTLAGASAVSAGGAAHPVSPLLAATAGRWNGELQYRDYENNTWQGLPMTVRIAVQPDSLTLIRTAAFDDGPQSGTVWITTVSQFDPASSSEAYAGFRKGREIDSGKRTLSLAGTPRDATHWTMVALETRKDGDSLAQVRETTTRDGSAMMTVKEVNPLDDGKDEWLPRNRTILKRIGR